MHVLGEFIKKEMQEKEWVDKAGKPLQVELVRRGGLDKRVVSWLLREDIQLRRMIDPATVTGLATAFAEADDLPEPERAEKIRSWEQRILLKSAEAIGIPVNEPVVIEVPGKPSDEYVLQRIRKALLLLRRTEEDGQNAVDPSVVEVAPNSGGADEEVGGPGSGERLRRTVSDRPRSRGSDPDDPEQRRAAERTAPPSI